MSDINGKTSFKRITQGEGDATKHFLVMCTLHEDNDDFEKSSLDLAVTCNHTSWRQEGTFLRQGTRHCACQSHYSELVLAPESTKCGRPGLKKPKTPHAQALKRIHMALSPERDSKIAFKVQLIEKEGTLQVRLAPFRRL